MIEFKRKKDFNCFKKKKEKVKVRISPPGQDSSDEGETDDDKDESNGDESDSSDDTFVKDTYYSSSSVWRSYTTRRQAKGMKEGEDNSG